MDSRNKGHKEKICDNTTRFTKWSLTEKRIKNAKKKKLYVCFLNNVEIKY